MNNQKARPVSVRPPVTDINALTDAGVDPAYIPTMVTQAVEDACAPSNPRPLTQEAAKDLYETAFRPA